MVNNKFLKITVFILLLTLPIAFVYLNLRFSVYPARISDTLLRLDSEIEQEDWESAIATVEELNNKWQQVSMHVSLNAGMDSLLDFEIALARLGKAVQRKAILDAQLELDTARVIWREFITF